MKTILDYKSKDYISYKIVLKSATTQSESYSMSDDIAMVESEYSL